MPSPYKGDVRQNVSHSGSLVLTSTGFCARFPRAVAASMCRIVQYERLPHILGLPILFVNVIIPFKVSTHP